MRLRRSTIAGVAPERTETPRPSSGEMLQRPQSRLQRMRSVLGSSRDEERIEDVAQPQSRRGTIVDAMLRPRRSLANLLGRRDGGEEEAHASSDEPDEAQSVRTFRAGPEYRQSQDERRESVESSLYSRDTDRLSYASDDTVRGLNSSNAVGRTSRGSEFEEDMNSSLPARTLHRASQFWQKSVTDLRRIAFQDSLRDIETPGQTAAEALTLLEGGNSASPILAEAPERSGGVEKAEIPATRRKSRLSVLSIGKPSAAAAELNGDPEKAAAAATKRKSRLSALSMGNIMSSVGLNTAKSPTATTPNDVSPRTQAPGEQPKRGLHRVTADEYARQYQSMLPPSSDAYAAFRAQHIARYAAERNGLTTTDPKDVDAAGRSDSKLAEAQRSPGSAETSRAQKKRATVGQPMAADREPFSFESERREAYTSSSRDSSATLDCAAFAPQFRLDDPRLFSDRQRKVYGSIPLDEWEAGKPEIDPFWGLPMDGVDYKQQKTTHMCHPLSNLTAHYRTARQARKESAAKHRAAKVAQRDKERRSEGLLRIALKRCSSVNTFTAADPAVFYKGKQGEPTHEGQGSGRGSIEDERKDLKAARDQIAKLELRRKGASRETLSSGEQRREAVEERNDLKAGREQIAEMELRRKVASRETLSSGEQRREAGSQENLAGSGQRRRVASREDLAGVYAGASTW
ncbi:hypothetical protein LTR10_005819 [Elasticomyces elasticus]|nr:hypothetical protein LTR10_005819 [Elasticomyces elasticus]KAK4965026.1 hypothetical protein LTR42_012444 [Elasticomyces elasticus]